MSLDRLRIKREASNPLMLPPVPKIPPELKKKYPQFAQLDTEWATWRNQAQAQLGQAIMAMRLDPGASSSVSVPTDNSDMLLQIESLSERISLLSNALNQLLQRVSNTETTVQFISAPLLDALALKANKAGDVFTGAIQAPLLVLVSEDAPNDKVGLYMTGTEGHYVIDYRKVT